MKAAAQRIGRSACRNWPALKPGIDFEFMRAN
jgi:hypothetical protein